ncbi:MAG: 1-deoxy-D-xylulose-5-phosphate reductoisomerase, partial [Candidatus Aureabacteria bacterium]|nr:1-deoxy-D-xylulose-5-phosphate reductoisomerase [Candidatus Auribacterota bacterium]
MKKKKISILGSTGSIGRNCLDVVRNSGGRFKIVSLSAGSNVKLLAAQIKEFNPRVAVIGNASKVGELKKLVPRSVKVTGGMEGLCGIASGRDVDIFVSALVGSAGLLPTIEAVKTGKRVALANKESLVMAGEFVMKLARKKGTEILPVDSEHSAVFQCISANRKETVRKITLTASGGPFLKTGISQMKNMTPSKALKHPRWKMGAKVTIDSATLMNKALEVIEAKWLFDVPSHMIDVVIHPESIVHSFVEFVDRSTIAQM